MAQEFEVARIPVSFDESALYTETYGFAGTSGTVFLEGQRLIPEGKASDAVILFMHPSSTLQLMPLPAALAGAGIHVLCAGSRYAKNDAAAIMEKVVIDQGAYVRHAKEELGYKNVILGGWSGGGSLALFYQSQAENPTITATPAGDPVDLHPLRPERVEVVAGEDGWPALYRYRVAEQVIDLALADADGWPEVIHLKGFHPGDDHYGAGCLAAAHGAVGVHNAASEWNRALLANAARPSGSPSKSSTF